MSARHAVVVGAGIGGLCTAVGLRKSGWSVTVLERWPEVVGVGAALGLWPEGQEALRLIGLGDGFDRYAVAPASAALYDVSGRELVHLDPHHKRIPDVRLISRVTLMKLLVEAADGIEIRTGVDADRALLEAEHPDVVIGADGLRSAVRTAYFGTATRPRYTGMAAWRGSVDFEAPLMGETWGNGMLFGHTPIEPGRTNFYAALPSPEREPVTFSHVQGVMAHWRPPVPEILDRAQPDDIFRNLIYDLHPALRSYVAGPVALLGDAAHAMAPNLGRGACEAILDAAALVRHLAGPSVPDALQAYDRERRRPSQRIARRSHQAMTIACARRLARPRDAVIRLAGRLVS